MQYVKKPCEEGDEDFVQKKLDEISDSLAPPEEGSEGEAKKNGAYMGLTEGFDRQVPFFRKHGCTENYAVEDIPKGHSEICLKKVL